MYLSTSTEDFPEMYLSTFQVLYKLYLSTDVLKYKVLLPGSATHLTHTQQSTLSLEQKFIVMFVAFQSLGFSLVASFFSECFAHSSSGLKCLTLRGHVIAFIVKAIT